MIDKFLKIKKLIDINKKFKIFYFLDFIVVILFFILNLPIYFYLIPVILFIFDFDKKIIYSIINLYSYLNFKHHFKNITNIDYYHLIKNIISTINFSNITNEEIKFLEYIKDLNYVNLKNEIYSNISEIEKIKSLLCPDQQNPFINNIVQEYFKEENNIYSLYIEKINLLKEFNRYSEKIKNENYELFLKMLAQYDSFLKDRHISISLKEKTIIFSM